MAEIGADLDQQAAHDACDASQGGAQEPDGADDPAHINAGNAGERRVFADRPHGATNIRAGHQQMHRDDASSDTPSISNWSGVARRPPPSFMAICSALVK